MKNVRQHSSALEAQLKRHFSADEARALGALFLFCLEHGGWSELDFERVGEAAYNPRAARTVHILLNDLGVREAALVAAGMLGTLLPPARALAAERGLSDAALEELSQSSPLVRLALWLDRLRHLHQASRPETLAALPELLEENRRQVALAKQHAPGFDALLEAWEERFRRMKKG